ncbi:MAG: transposase, partial [Endomicrobium sp.]|nr:transposase [Endomicrobium sp.]
MSFTTGTTEKANGIFINLEEMYNLAKTSGLKDVAKTVNTLVINGILRYEADQFLTEKKDYTIENSSRRRYVANGYHISRKISISFGNNIEIAVPRIRDLCPYLPDSEKYETIFFKKYERTDNSINDFALDLYLKGISQTKISYLMNAIFYEPITGFSQSSISNKTKRWFNDYEQFKQKDLSDLKNGILLIDGSYVKTKNIDKNICLLSAIYMDNYGYKIVGWQPVESESEKNWSEFFKHLTEVQHFEKPCMIITDGGSGGLAAIDKFFPGVLVQRCWVHKVRNILDELPDELYDNAINALRKIYKSEFYEDAIKQVDNFNLEFSKYPKIVKLLNDDIDFLLSFYKLDNLDKFKIYTNNLIESVFAVFKLRYNKIKGMCSLKTVGYSTYKMIEHLNKKYSKNISFSNNEKTEIPNFESVETLTALGIPNSESVETLTALGIPNSESVETLTASGISNSESVETLTASEIPNFESVESLTASETQQVTMIEGVSLTEPNILLKTSVTIFYFFVKKNFYFLSFKPAYKWRGT